ncbi:MAG: ABC transporter permease, partial [Thaumarchaeota archaeon]|nr:ABC transporter permease [Nitrososphaerota archaeon]
VIVASYASTISATSIALEKESKTLEVLLTIPTRRLMILLSKLLGTFFIVILSTVSFLVGFGIYSLMLAGSMEMSSSLGGLGETSSVQFSLSAIQPSSIFLPILVASIFIAMVMMTCIGLLVGILGGDVRSAQQLVGAITFPLLMPPFFILLFTSIESLPLGIRLALLADPFTHLFLAIRSGFTGDLASALMSIGVMLGFTILLLVLSSWFFMGERLITMRISLRRRGSSET